MGLQTAFKSNRTVDHLMLTVTIVYVISHPPYKLSGLTPCFFISHRDFMRLKDHLRKLLDSVPKLENYKFILSVLLFFTKFWVNYLAAYTGLQSAFKSNRTV